MPTARKPTHRQLSYLKNLANRTGQTFTYPQTSSQASAEINRLKHAQPSSRTERYVERKLIADQIATGPLDAARVREDEISGRGSSASWMPNREQEPPPMQDPGPASPRRHRAPVVRQRTELARYTVSEGERILYGQRIDGIVRFLPGEARRLRRFAGLDRGQHVSFSDGDPSRWLHERSTMQATERRQRASSPCRS